MLKDVFIKQKQAYIKYLKNEKQAAHNTVKSYTLDLEQFTTFWNLKERELRHESLTFKKVLSLFFETLQKSLIDRSSIARKTSCINSFNDFLKKQGFSLDIKLKRPYIPTPIPQALDIKELLNFLNSISYEDLPTRHPFRDKAIIELLYATGIRCSELVSIELGNVNFKHCSIIIRGNKKKERIVYFGTKAHKLLVNYLHYERPSAKSLHECLFLNYRAAPLTVRSIQRICKMVQTILQTSIPITPHILRHSYAAHMIYQGADLNTIKELLGHKTKVSTEKYLKVILENKIL